jgi:hypothetical protein
MDFKVGDLVRVKQNHSAPYSGAIGTVAKVYEDGVPYPISVDLRELQGNPAARDVPYTEAELKVIS